MSLKDDFKKPINIVTTSITIISVVLSIFFYYQSKKEKVPTYLIPDDHSIVYNSTESSPSIKVIGKDSTIIKNNIYLAAITFWNSGEIPIESSDVRRQIKLVLNPCNKIFDIKIIEQTHPDISKFNLKAGSINDSIKTINITWNHFDPNHGVKFQIMYTGNKTADLYFDGIILGVSGFKNGKAFTKKYKWLQIILSVISVFLLSIGLNYHGDKIKPLIDSKIIIKSNLLKRTISMITNIVIVFLWMSILIYLFFYFTEGVSPPF